MEQNIISRRRHFVGVGPGAHGRLTLETGRFSTEAPRNPDQWLLAVERGEPQESRGVLSPDDQGLEYLLMGLRLSAGVDFPRLQRIFGRDLDPLPIQRLARLGKAELSANRLRATPEGRLILNAVITELATAWT